MSLSRNDVDTKPHKTARTSLHQNYGFHNAGNVPGSALGRLQCGNPSDVALLGVFSWQRVAVLHSPPETSPKQECFGQHLRADGRQAVKDPAHAVLSQRSAPVQVSQSQNFNNKPHEIANHNSDRKATTRQQSQGCRNSALAARTKGEKPLRRQFLRATWSGGPGRVRSRDFAAALRVSQRSKTTT